MTTWHAVRQFVYRLCYTNEGHLDLTWLITGWVLGLASVGVVSEAIGHLLSRSAWAFLIGAFSTALLSAIPIAKARLLRNATAPGTLTSAVASALESVGVRAPTGIDQAEAEAEKPA